MRQDRSVRLDEGARRWQLRGAMSRDLKCACGLREAGQGDRRGGARQRRGRRGIVDDNRRGHAGRKQTESRTSGSLHETERRDVHRDDALQQRAAVDADGCGMHVGCVARRSGWRRRRHSLRPGEEHVEHIIVGDHGVKVEPHRLGVAGKDIVTLIPDVCDDRSRGSSGCAGSRRGGRGRGRDGRVESRVAFQRLQQTRSGRDGDRGSVGVEPSRYLVRVATAHGGDPTRAADVDPNHPLFGPLIATGVVQHFEDVGTCRTESAGLLRRQEVDLKAMNLQPPRHLQTIARDNGRHSDSPVLVAVDANDDGALLVAIAVCEGQLVEFGLLDPPAKGSLNGSRAGSEIFWVVAPLPKTLLLFLASQFIAPLDATRFPGFENVGLALQFDPVVVEEIVVLLVQARDVVVRPEQALKGVLDVSCQLDRRRGTTIRATFGTGLRGAFRHAKKNRGGGRAEY